MSRRGFVVRIAFVLKYLPFAENPVGAIGFEPKT